MNRANSAENHRKLTFKQELFATEYVATGVVGNGTEAARRAGYKGNDATLAQVAHENLRKPEIKACIAELRTDVEKSAQERIMLALKNIQIGEA